MEKLRESFRKNGLHYQLIKRNDVVALYGVGGTYTDKTLHYEICQIYINKEADIFGQHFPESEVIASNELFGREGSRAIIDHKEALNYFDYLTTWVTKNDKHNLPPFIGSNGLVIHGF